MVGVFADRWDEGCFVGRKEGVEVSVGGSQCLEIFGVVRDVWDDLEH